MLIDPLHQLLFYPQQYKIHLQVVAPPLQSMLCFSKMIPVALGCSVNFKIALRFLCRRLVFPDLPSVSCEYVERKKLLHKNEAMQIPGAKGFSCKQNLM